MKKKKLIMTVLFICLFSLGVLSGCQISSKMVGDDHSAEGYYKVSLFYNGGTSDGSEYHERFIPKNARLPFPGTSSSPINNPTRPAHTLAGWYQILPEVYGSRDVNRTKTVVDETGATYQVEVTDQAGNYVVDKQYYIKGYDFKNGGDYLTLSDYENDEIRDTIFMRKWNFEIDKVKEDIVLVPLWKSTREYVFISEENNLKDPNDPFFNSKTTGGKYEYTWFMNPDGSIKRPTSTSEVPQKTYYQVEGYYRDSRFLDEIIFDAKGLFYPEITYTEDGAVSRFPIYVKYISNDYTIINGINDFYFNQETREYTFRNDAGTYKGFYLRTDIDFGGAALNLRSMANNAQLSFRGDIRGNNYTLKNFVVNIDQHQTRAFYGAIFGDITNAGIHNITFSDFTVNFKRNANIPDYLGIVSGGKMTINALCDGDIPSTATVRNVTVSGMTVIDTPATDFERFDFTYEEGKTNERVKYNATANAYYVYKGADERLGSAIGIFTQDQSEWDSRQRLVFGQSGDEFNPNSIRVVNFKAPTPTLVEWENKFIRDDITADNYYELLPQASVTVMQTYTFFGWFDVYGNQYGIGHPIPEEGVTVTVYAMYAP